MNMDLAMFFVKHGFREMRFLYDLIEDTWEVKILTPKGGLSLLAKGRTPYDCCRELKKDVSNIEPMDEILIGRRA